jgi:hypothetical protein
MVRRSRRTTTARRGGIFSRLRGRRNETVTTTTTTTTRRTRKNRRAEPVHDHRRRAGIGDKISGAFMKLEGTLTRRPGLKVRSTPLS